MILQIIKMTVSDFEHINHIPDQSYFDVAITSFKNLLKTAVLKERLNKTDMEKIGQNF